jgi:hypothetical protein
MIQRINHLRDKMKVFMRYTHHGRDVAVRAELKGKHKDFCLCYSCEKFKPNMPENCPIAQENYELCVKRDLVLPVWECPEFEVA